MIWRNTCVAFLGLALLSAAAGASAQATVWPYDGTGSQTDKPSDNPPPDNSASIAKLRKAADGGDNEARVNLGSVLEQAYPVGTPDLAGALALYEKAADEYNRYGRERMCVAYLLGEGRPVNLAKAMSYCSKLPDTDPVGLFSAGYEYDHGIGGPKDVDTAIAFYSQAIKAGSGEAMDAIGEKAMDASNPSGARRWFRQAVVAGSADGMAHLAALLESGQGGAVDADEAGWLYVNAARRGNADAARWVAAHPDWRPLQRVQVADGKTSLISQTITDDKGTRTIPFDIAALAKAMADYYPPNAAAMRLDASVSIHCYIDGGNRIDVCLPENEYPVGYGFGPLVLALYNGDLSVPATNTSGETTANKVAVFTYHWTVDR